MPRSTIKVFHPKKGVFDLVYVGRDIYRFRDGVAVEKRCSKCQEYRPTGHFPLIKGRTLFSRCRACAKIVAKEWRDKPDSPYRKRTPPKYYVEYDVTRNEEGMKGIVCLTCQTWKPLTDMMSYRHNGKTYHRRECKLCAKLRQQNSGTLRRNRAEIDQHPGLDEYLKNEKRPSHFKAVCWMLGVVSYRGIRTQKKRALRRVLPRVQLGSPMFEAAKKAALKALQENGWRVPNVPVLPLWRV